MRTWMKIAVVALTALPFAASPKMATAEVVQVPNSDATMDAAIAKAKATLPVFFARLAAPQPGDQSFAVKIRYPTKGANGEHIWASQVVEKDGMVTATISNQPEEIPDLKMGQRVTVPTDRITDWMYIRDSKIIGGQTIRAMLPFMPPAQAAQYKAMLAPE